MQRSDQTDRTCLQTIHFLKQQYVPSSCFFKKEIFAFTLLHGFHVLQYNCFVTLIACITFGFSPLYHISTEPQCTAVHYIWFSQQCITFDFSSLFLCAFNCSASHLTAKVFSSTEAASNREMNEFELSQRYKTKTTHYMLQ